MQVEIWSDIMCPFCYIGKRRFENALKLFPNASEIEVIWKSYQLDPNQEDVPGKSINQYLAERKGWTVEYAREMNKYVTDMAAGEGLVYDMDKAVVANSFNAHRLIQMAKTKGLGDAAEEAFFNAYFTKGININDAAEIMAIGVSIGLNEQDIADMLDSGQFVNEVRADAAEAAMFGARGVPFFVFNRKYAISGAQPNEAFSQVLATAFSDWKLTKENSPVVIKDGDMCDTDGNC